MNKFQRSGRLIKASLAVLWREKKLLLFPFAATALALAAFVFFALPILFYPTAHSVFTADHWRELADQVARWAGTVGHARASAGAGGTTPAANWRDHLPAGAGVFMAVVYFVSMFLATFSNVAFYHEIMQALNGNPVSLRRGYRFAAGRWQAVLWWSLFAGLVGYVIRAIEERVGFLGRIIAGLIGVTWSIACVFIIPTLVRDRDTANPLKLLQNSAGTLKRTWGELVIGFVGLELVFTTLLVVLLAGLVVAVVVLAMTLGTQHAGMVLALSVVGGAFVVLAAVAMSWVSSLVNPVYRCALYVYATEGVIPETFNQELLDTAWKVK